MQEARTDSREIGTDSQENMSAQTGLEKRRAYGREWYARNRDRLAAKRAARTPEQVERERARKRDYYRRNKGKLDAKAQKYREVNRERIAAYYREYRAANPETLRTYSRAYYWTNRDRILAERRALRAAVRARKEKARPAPTGALSAPRNHRQDSPQHPPS